MINLINLLVLSHSGGVVFMNDTIIFNPIDHFSGVSNYGAFGVDGRVSEPGVKRLMSAWSGGQIDQLREILNSTHVSEGSAKVEFKVSTLGYKCSKLYCKYMLYFHFHFIYFTF